MFHYQGLAAQFDPAPRDGSWIKCPFPDYICNQSFNDRKLLVLHYAFEHGALYRLVMHRTEEAVEALVADKRKDEKLIEDLRMRAGAVGDSVHDQMDALNEKLCSLDEQNGKLVEKNKKLARQVESAEEAHKKV